MSNCWTRCKYELETFSTLPLQWRQKRGKKDTMVWLHPGLSPNFITLTFTETSLRGKLWTQIMKVVNTNHLKMSRCLRQSPWQDRGKPVCVDLMEFRPLQCTRKVRDKVRNKFPTKSWTQIMKVGDLIYVADFHDLCPRQMHNFVENLSWTLLQSRRNGIWALHSQWFSLD